MARAGSSALFEYSLQADNLPDLRTWIPQIVKALSQRPELADVNTNQQDKGQQIALQVDRDLAARLGVSQALIDATLNNAFGQRQVSVIYNPLNQYHVIMEVAPDYSQSQEALKNIYVSVPSGGQVPLSAFASYSVTNTPLSVNHQSQFPAGTISFNLKPGISLSDATRVIAETMNDLGVPATLHGSFQGTAKAFKESLRKPTLADSGSFGLDLYRPGGSIRELYPSANHSFHPTLRRRWRDPGVARFPD